KEYAGQERACGAAAFAVAAVDAPRRAQWLQLIAAQERSFALYAELAGPALCDAWLQAQPAAELAELERMRRIAFAAPEGGALDANLSTAWFDCCTLRIDAMQAVEERLRAELQALCGERIAQARADAERHEALLAQAHGAA
ncbi:nitrate- and nitrite sensing domain-containing protein, partial [Bradyrhizobium sp. NBAIM08]|uniref:nitrate- and nitrite sensing domain-containing protein n=1 Tax=Bradyrhizobium sp. NBAIM08 TaxID=2793815 RepID=UPI001CD24A71